MSVFKRQTRISSKVNEKWQRSFIIKEEEKEILDISGVKEGKKGKINYSRCHASK
jgi:hypothetical protein